MNKESMLHTAAWDARKARTTDRNAQYYFNAFGLRPSDLEGKTILDIGAMLSDFGYIAKKCGAKTAVSFDAQYPAKLPYAKDEAVGGLAQILPFKNESFDLVVASYSFYWIKNMLPQALREGLRVTKNGGDFHIYPAYERSEGRLPEQATIELKNQMYIHPTLSIRKSAEWTPQDMREIAESLSRSVSFHTKIARDSRV